MKLKSFLLLSAILCINACTRIETGEVGLRVGFDKQINQTELLPGSFNQTIIGDIKLFPVKDVTILKVL